MSTAQILHPGFRGQFGFGRSDITPPIGIYARNWGAAKGDLAESIHRPLHLTAMTIASDQSDPPLIFIDADLGWWKTPEFANEFRQQLLEQLKIPTENLIFALSHTHAAPPLMTPDDSLPGSDVLGQWLDGLVGTTIDTVQQAIDSSFPGVIEWHMGRCDLATVRDFPDPNADRILCGYEPSGKADDSLLVGRITNEGDEVQAVIVNYACHPTTLAWENKSVSPDYIGAMRETIQNEYDAYALFAIGACGDLAPRIQYQGDPGVADRHGQKLGYAVLATLAGMDPPQKSYAYERPLESGASLAIWSHQARAVPTTLNSRRTVAKLPLKNWPSADELEQQRLACTDRALEERLRRKRDIRRFLGDGDSFELEIFVWRLGESILIGTCCEPYSVLQQELRKRNPGIAIACMNLINGSIGYLPPAELYSKEIYPVWQTPFDKGSLELTIDAMDTAIKQILDEQ